MPLLSEHSLSIDIGRNEAPTQCKGILTGTILGSIAVGGLMLYSIFSCYKSKRRKKPESSEPTIAPHI